MMIPSSKPEALYLHVPFCAHICYYCDFCHTVYNAETAEAWLKAIQEQFHQKEINPCLKTIYIGGGTPTALSSKQLDTLLNILDPYSRQVQEYTIEINPEGMDEEKAEVLQNHHINRASIGLQSSDPALLKMMGRHHDFAMVKRTVELLKNHGIDNISLDILYSLPNQTMDQLRQTIYDALSLHPKHLSLYSLTIEEHTVFSKKGYTHLDEDSEADMYEMICRILPEYGYRQYEISNFALPGYESRHNSAYWNYDDFYGIGCGASGKEGNCRYDNTDSIRTYLKDPMAHEDIPLSREDQMFEMVMMGMRFKRGMNLQLFEERFHVSFARAFGKKAENLYNKGLIENKDGCVRAKGHAYEILNSILEDLM